MGYVMKFYLGPRHGKSPFGDHYKQKRLLPMSPVYYVTYLTGLYRLNPLRVQGAK